MIKQLAASVLVLSGTLSWSFPTTPAALASPTPTLPVVASEGLPNDFTDFPDLPDCPEGEVYDPLCILMLQTTTLQCRASVLEHLEWRKSTILSEGATALANARTDAEKAAIRAQMVADLAEAEANAAASAAAANTAYIEDAMDCCVPGTGSGEAPECLDGLGVLSKDCPGPVADVSCWLALETQFQEEVKLLVLESDYCTSNRASPTAAATTRRGDTPRLGPRLRRAHYGVRHPVVAK